MEKVFNCLLIDDDPDDQELFRYALQKLNLPIKLTIADDGVYGVEKLEEPGFLPEVIFVDLNMPRLNGLECIAEIKKMERLNNVPVYIYSTAHEYQNNIDTVKLGIKEYIEKPSNVMELIPILSRIIKPIM